MADLRNLINKQANLRVDQDLLKLDIETQEIRAKNNLPGAATELVKLRAQLSKVDAELASVSQQISQLRSQTTSAGKVVQDDQAGFGEKSNTVDPKQSALILKNGRIQPQPDTTSGTNAEPAVSQNNVDRGLNAPVKKYSETQSTTPGSNLQSPGPIPVTGRTAPVPSGGLPGATPPSDDSGRQNTGAGSGTGTNSSVVSALNGIDWEAEIKPQNNVLDQYASYTYQASLYLLDKNSYQRAINTGSKDLANAQLLVQSGGASQGTGRSDFFSLDYYIDRMELKSFVAGKSVRLSHNVKEVEMTIVEPNGISFLQNLDAAVQQYLGGEVNKKRNFASQIYLLVIRFYGYDAQGNLVRGGNTNNQTSDPNAFVEKWYPLIISKFSFKVASKGIEYHITAKAPPYQINASSQRGSIPFNVEFSGKTIKDVLGGPAVYATQLSAQAAASARRAFAAVDPRRVDSAGDANAAATAPAKADAITSNKKTVRQGLMASLNEYQQQLVNDGVIQYPDEYNVEFALDEMASATIINPGVNKSATSMATTGTAADQKLGSKQSMDPNSQTLSATAGMQIVQFIDNLLKNSSYIRDQQTIIIDAKTGVETPGPGAALKNTAWYKIGFKAEPKLDQYDEKRNDYAYKITYVISPYKISNLNSPYFKAPVYNGRQKSYQYWFTGLNSSVLSYEETFDKLYYLVLSNPNFGGSGITSSVSGAENIVVSELLTYSPQPTSGQSTTGAEGRTLEPPANASDQLYNPSDLKECNMTIVGDPAWLQQGESFAMLPKGDPYYFRAFLPDGTINFDSQQILFEVAFNAPRDYNLLTGLAQPSANKLNSMLQSDQVTKTPENSQFSRIYIAKEVISHFDKGKFTQTLKGSLMVYYPPGQGEGRPPPQNIPTATKQAAATKSKAPVFATTLRSSVTNPTPTSSLAKGVQQILTPAVQADNPSLSQLQSSPVYIQARRNGATPAAALDAARAAFAAGTNNAANFAAPGIRTGPQKIVKDQ